MQVLLLVFIKALAAGLNSLPLARRVKLLHALIRIYAALNPRMRRVALRNLELCFPEKTDEWRRAVLEKSLYSFARIVMDSIRLPELDAEWVKKHVQVDFLPRYLAIKAGGRGPGAVFATGHLGSFDLMGHCIPFLVPPIAFIVRNFKLERIDRWFNGIRQADGNQVIDRKGALKGALQTLRRGTDVAILFDQNVRKEHAVFVPWFNIPSATTSLPAIAALRNKAPVLVASIQHAGDDNYRFHIVECDFQALYDDESKSAEQKILEITRRISAEYEKMIRAAPEEWFWMHRRFRTRPPGEERDLYEGC